MKPSEFVRSRPVDMPAAQVVKEAAAMGVKVHAHTVHTVRSNDRLRARGAPPPVVKPGSRHDRILAFIRTYLEKHNGKVPNRKEIADAIGCGVNAVNQTLGALKERGIVDYPHGDSTRLRLLDGAKATGAAKARKPARGASKSNGHAAPPSLAGLLGPGTGESAPEYHVALKRDLARLLEELEGRIAAVRSVLTLLG